MMDEKILKGTTTIGLTCKDGVVFACDKRASMGTFISSNKAKKAFRLNDIVGMTVAGSVGDAEALVRLMQAEASLYEYSNREEMPPNAMANLMANVLQGNKLFPYLVQLLIGGIGKKGAELFTLDPIGGLIEESYASTGSGSPVAYGVLERDYSKEKSVSENIPIALTALSAAMKRDAATGDGMTLVTITKDGGFKDYSEKEVKDLVKKRQP